MGSQLSLATTIAFCSSTQHAESMPRRDHPCNRNKPHSSCRTNPSKRRPSWGSNTGTALRICSKPQSGCGPIHLHIIALDGVYTIGKLGKAKFHRVKAPNQTELQTLLNRVIQRVIHRLEKEGLLIQDPEQPWLDLGIDEPIDAVITASIRYRIAMGPHSGSRTLTLHDPSLTRTDRPVKALTADRDGFSLNVALSSQPHQRDRLERLYRYVTRPAICLDRLIVRADGKIQYELKSPFRNGTTHILSSPLDFLSKLAALVPRPRHNLARYHGVLARGCRQPNARMRKLIVPTKRKKTHSKADQNERNSTANC